jgi:hypothetical protein
VETCVEKASECENINRRERVRFKGDSIRVAGSLDG